MKKIITITAITALALFSCKKEKSEEPEETPDPVSFKFAADVQPIFNQSCGTGTFCHSTSNAADSKVFETHAGASAVPNSTILGALKHESGFEAMPKNTSGSGSTKLSNDKIAIIEAWINGGKLND